MGVKLWGGEPTSVALAAHHASQTGLTLSTPPCALVKRCIVHTFSGSERTRSAGLRAAFSHKCGQNVGKPSQSGHAAEPPKVP